MMDQKDIIKEDEIDLIAVVSFLWNKRFILLKFLIVTLLIGLLYVVTYSNEYRVVTKLLPEAGETGKGSISSLSSLAGLAGINLDFSSIDAFPPQLYAEMCYSVPFQMKLINRPVYFGKLDSTMSTLQYFKEFHSSNILSLVGQYTLGLPGIIKRLIIKVPVGGSGRDQKFISLSKEDWDYYQGFMERQSVDLDKESGIVYIGVEMPDRRASAEVAKLIVEQLTNQITEYKLAKLRTNLAFVSDRYLEAKERYEVAQLNLAEFSDKNQFANSARVEVKRQQLQNELNLTFEIYRGLESQLEQSKMKVKENTPVFTVLEPVILPVEKSKPKRLFILIGFCFGGLLLGIAYIFLSLSIKTRMQALSSQ